MKTDEGSSAAKARQVETRERYLAFLLGKEQYAIPLLTVKEVIEICEPTPIPQTPRHFKGIINLRGQVISVIDLRTKFQLEKAENGPKTAIIILELDPHYCIGVIVDRISSVLAFRAEDISDAPETLDAKGHQYIVGVAQRDKKLTLILDITAALSLDDLHLVKTSATPHAA